MRNATATITTVEDTPIQAIAVFSLAGPLFASTGAGDIVSCSVSVEACI